ncbi:MAG: DUF4091 domain-containing protein [Candidatus Omnitrophica bacterium]|nr:DUF4091 domain-containing protein [Candidatus Omnitrophota bacterium]
MIKIAVVDPLIKVFKDSNLPETDHVPHAVRGEVVSLQAAITSPADVTIGLINPITLSCGGSVLTGTSNFVGFVPVRQNTPDTPETELVRKAPALFPDPILGDMKNTVAAGETCPLWITVTVSEECPPGTYKGDIIIAADGKKVSKGISIIVHKARLPGKRNLWITNWVVMHKLVEYLKCEYWSEEHWRYIENIARDLGAHRQNMVFTPTMGLIDFAREGGKLKIGFDRFDRWVNLFDKYGAADLIEGTHLCYREGHKWDANELVFNDVHIRNPERTGSDNIIRAKAGSDTCKKFIAEFFPILKRHLAGKGWLKKYVQHIADEPNKTTLASWQSFAGYFRGIAPGIKVIDAVMTKDLTGLVDIWVPLLDHYDNERDFFRSRQKLGEDVWFYTCLIPRGHYPNRLVDFSLLKVRLLHWINFCYGITGYLHWGYNWWTDKPFSDVEFPVGNNACLPAGDNAIVYPGTTGVLPSIRWEIMRKGIEDYELLLKLRKHREDKSFLIAREAVPEIRAPIKDAGRFYDVRSRVITELDAIEN